MPRFWRFQASMNGTSRTAAARIGGIDFQTVCDEVPAFNTQWPAGLVGGKAPGHPPLLSDA